MRQDPSSRPATGYPYSYPYPNPTQPGVANGYPPPSQPAGTAYAYQNPYYAPPNPNPRAAFYRRLMIIFTVCLLTMAIIFFIFYIVVKPHFPDVNLTSLSVDNFSVSGNQVSGNWDVRFQVRNPNHKMSLYYYDIYCKVYYHRELLTSTRLPPFNQGTRDQTTLNASLSVTGTYVEGGLADSIRKDRASIGRVEFDLKVDSVVMLKYGLFRRRKYATFFCDDVAVGLPANRSSGKMIGPGKEC